MMSSNETPVAPEGGTLTPTFAVPIFGVVLAAGVWLATDESLAQPYNWLVPLTWLLAFGAAFLRYDARVARDLSDGHWGGRRAMWRSVARSTLRALEDATHVLFWGMFLLVAIGHDGLMFVVMAGVYLVPVLLTLLFVMNLIANLRARSRTRVA